MRPDMSEADAALTIARRALERIATGQAARIEHLVAKNALDEMFRVHWLHLPPGYEARHE